MKISLYLYFNKVLRCVTINNINNHYFLLKTIIVRVTCMIVMYESFCEAMMYIYIYTLKCL